MEDDIENNDEEDKQMIDYDCNQEDDYYIYEDA